MAPTDTLRILLQNVDFRLPTQITDDNSVVALKSLVFEPLLRWQSGGLVKPALFSSWSHSSSGRNWRFTIRKNAVFHDGKSCTADDVVTYIKGLLHSRDYFGMLWSYARYFKDATIAAEDDRTVTIENPEPFADVLDILCEFWPCRLASNGKPVLGTGLYRVVEFERESGALFSGSAKLERVDQALDYLPRNIVATHERSGEKRLEALRAGEVDAVLNLERADDLGVVDFDPSLKWGRVTSTLSAMYYLNCPSGIFSSPDVRLAANSAVDNDALVKEVFHGLALPSATIVSPLHLGSKEANLKPIPYDPDRARTLVEGVDKSTPIQLRTPQWMPEHAEKISQFVASSLEAIGFKVEISVETNRPEYARSIGLRKHIGDLALFDSTPNSTFRVLDDKVSSESKNTWWLGYHDDDVQELVREARQQVDDKDRANAYAKCLRRLQENPPWLYIAHPDVVWATRKDLKTTINVGCNGVLTLS